jgi:SAM-dependent methyltransferase
VHLFEFLIQSGHYHVGLAPAAGEPLSRAMDRLVSECFGKLRPSGRVLDVGAGLGGTVALLARAGFHAVGVDPDSLAVAYARARAPASAELRCGLLSEVSDGPYDALLLTEVLQYHRELDPFLGRCRALLAPGGCVIVHDAALRVEANWDAVPYHQAGALAAAAARAGFEVREQRDLTPEILPTFGLLAELFRARRADVLAAFAGRAEVDRELDELARHAGHLERGFSAGQLVYERTSLTVQARVAP